MTIKELEEKLKNINEHLGIEVSDGKGEMVNLDGGLGVKFSPKGTVKIIFTTDSGEVGNLVSIVPEKDDNPSYIAIGDEGELGVDKENIDMLISILKVAKEYL